RGAIPLVRRHELEVPAYLAGIGIGGDEGIRVERVARAARGRRPRCRLSGREIDELELGIVAHRVPRRTAERRPDAVVRPRLVAGLAGPRRGVECPQMLAGLRVEGLEAAARREVAAGHADEDLAVGDQRRVRMAAPFRVVARLRLPELLPGARIERDEEAVRR